MATVTKPIALDESLNTTELSSRNVADVLAQELSAVATAIGGISAPSAEDVSYDNSGSGLTATDVQNAIDELSSEKADSSSLATVATSGDYDDLINKPTIPTVNDATLTIQKNGTTVATFSANASSNASANITVPTTTSELTNNSDFVSDASYVHTDNNFTTAEKTKLSGIESGAEVNVQSDWNEADNTADDFIKNKPSSEVKSATDTFTTVNGGLLEECNINLVPVQSGSGDPSPDNVRPISGHTEVKLQRDGKNLLNTDSPDVISAYVQNDGSINSSLTWTTSELIRIDSAKPYVLSGLTDHPNTGIDNYRTYDANKNYIGYVGKGIASYPITFSSDVKYVQFCWKNVDKSTVMFEQNSVATTYEPYLGTLYTVQIGQTVYGGTVDLVSGVMTVIKAKAITPTRGAIDSSGKLYNINFSGGTIHNFDQTTTKTPYIICSHLDVDSLAGARDTQRKCICQYAEKVYIGGYVGEETALDNMLASADFSIVYELATPFTIQLTPTQIEALPSQNNLSTPLDGQSIDSVKYREVFAFDDVEKVVSLRVPISMLGTDESGRTTASQSYASGDYFYKDGYMCKALTSISAGATLTLNTNYSQGTLADILKAIENA